MDQGRLARRGEQGGAELQRAHAHVDPRLLAQLGAGEEALDIRMSRHRRAIPRHRHHWRAGWAYLFIYFVDLGDASRKPHVLGRWSCTGGLQKLAKKVKEGALSRSLNLARRRTIHNRSVQ